MNPLLRLLRVLYDMVVVVVGRRRKEEEAIYLPHTPPEIPWV